MRALVCHVRYREPGGEDAVFETEVALLREYGVDVDTLDLRSGDLRALPLRQRARIALNYADHRWGRSVVRAAIERHRPDVVHFHNIFPMLGPGAIAEADSLGCATLQTLHNHRLSCLTGRYSRDGQLCESCTPGHFGAGVRHGCYRGSRVLGFLVGRATTRQWQGFCSGRVPLVWLALSPFAKQFYVDFGAPAERVVVKANGVSAGRPVGMDGRSGVFCAGLLSPEKGIIPLMRSWPDDGPVLSVAGDGPLRAEAVKAARHNVRYMGYLSHGALRERLRQSRAVVIPSLSSEGLPLVALEAFSEGTPAIAFEGWSLGSMLRDLSPRCVVPRGGPSELAHRACNLSRAADWLQLSERCVQLWSSRYSHSASCESLVSAYRKAVALKREQSCA